MRGHITVAGIHLFVYQAEYNIRLYLSVHN